MPYNRKKKETKRTHWPTKYRITQNPLVSCKRRDHHIVCVTQHSSPQSNHIPFPLCLWSNEQTNHVWKTWLYVSRRALGSEHASQFEINQSIVVGSVSASNKNVNFVKVCFKRLSNFQVKKKKGLIDLQTLTRIGCFFLTCICMMNFMCRMCSLCCCTCEDETLNVTYSNKSNLINYRWPISQNYTRQLYKHIHVVHHVCSACLLAAAAAAAAPYLINFE